MQDTYTPDPFKNYKPRQNPANISNTGGNESQSDVPALDLTRLGEMGRDELLRMFKLIYNAAWGKRGLTGAALINVALNTPDEVAEAFKLKLAAGGLNEDDMFKALPIMREWFDRSLGKAAQSIKMTVEDKGLGKLSDTRLLRLESELARITGSEAIIIMPEPKKLEED